jgi:hypothetical protein
MLTAELLILGIGGGHEELLPGGTVLTQVLRWNLLISLQRELRCLDPLILKQSLLIFRDSLPHDCKLSLQLGILRNRRHSRCKHYGAHHHGRNGIGAALLHATRTSPIHETLLRDTFSESSRTRTSC